jgi:hypothetical protein
LEGEFVLCSLELGLPIILAVRFKMRSLEGFTQCG